MNEQQIADKLADIIDARITKALEPLQLQVATLNQLNVDLKSEVETLTAKHDSLVGSINIADEQMNTDFDELKTQFNDLTDDINNVSTIITDQKEALIHIPVNLEKELLAVKDDIDSRFTKQSRNKEITDSTLVQLGDKVSELSEKLDGRDEDVKTLMLLPEKINSNFLISQDYANTLDTTMQVRLLEALDAHKSDVNTGLDDFNNEISETLASNYKTTLEKQSSELNDAIEKVRLNSVNLINTELLRLNDHVNTKLTSLKGEKGDTGEKGNEGSHGFLSGVSLWKTGHITKRYEAVSYLNSLWLCSCEQTAQEPGCGDDYQLIHDGIKSVELDDKHHLIVTMGSDKQVDLGYVGFKFKGEYSNKSPYDKNDLVTLKGTAYISLVSDNTNLPPSNTWKYLVKRGSKGSPGEKGDEGKAFNFDASAFMDDVTAVIDTVIDKKIKVQ